MTSKNCQRELGTGKSLIKSLNRGILCIPPVDSCTGCSNKTTTPRARANRHNSRLLPTKTYAATGLCTKRKPAGVGALFELYPLQSTVIWDLDLPSPCRKGIACRCKIHFCTQSPEAVLVQRRFPTSTEPIQGSPRGASRSRPDVCWFNQDHVLPEREQMATKILYMYIL